MKVFFESVFVELCHGINYEKVLLYQQPVMSGFSKKASAYYEEVNIYEKNKDYMHDRTIK